MSQLRLKRTVKFHEEISARLHCGQQERSRKWREVTIYKMTPLNLLTHLKISWTDENP